MKNIIFIIFLLIPSYCFSQKYVNNSMPKNTIITVQKDTINSTSHIDKVNNSKSENDNIFQIYNITINGLILIIVAIIGAYFHRRTQFESFIFQKRIEVFSTFLSESEKCFRDAFTNIIIALTNKDKFDQNSIPSIIANIYWPMTMSQFSVKLLLDKEHKIRFEEIMKKLPELTIHDMTLTKGEKPKSKEIESHFKEIESMLMQSIENTPQLFKK